MVCDWNNERWPVGENIVSQFIVELDEEEMETLQNALEVYKARLVIAQVNIPEGIIERGWGDITVQLLSSSYVQAKELRERLVKVSGYDMTIG